MEKKINLFYKEATNKTTEIKADTAVFFTKLFNTSSFIYGKILESVIKWKFVMNIIKQDTNTNSRTGIYLNFC